MKVSKKTRTKKLKKKYLHFIFNDYVKLFAIRKPIKNEDKIEKIQRNEEKNKIN